MSFSSEDAYFCLNAFRLLCIVSVGIPFKAFPNSDTTSPIFLLIASTLSSATGLIFPRTDSICDLRFSYFAFSRFLLSIFKYVCAEPISILLPPLLSWLNLRQFEYMLHVLLSIPHINPKHNLSDL